MNKNPIFSFILALAFLTACTNPSAAPSATGTTPEADAAPSEPQLEAEIVEVVNLVDAHANIPDPWEPASLGMRIFPGGEVWAKEASTARLGLGESLIRVAPNTIFTLNRPDDQTIQLNLNEGQIWLNVEGLEEGDEFKVEMPGATASVRGTRFSSFVTKEGVRGVSVLTGKVLFATEAGQKTVEAGMESIAYPGQAPSDPAPNSLKTILLWANAVRPDLNISIPFTGYEACLPSKEPLPARRFSCPMEARLHTSNMIQAKRRQSSPTTSSILQILVPTLTYHTF